MKATPMYEWHTNDTNKGKMDEDFSEDTEINQKVQKFLIFMMIVSVIIVLSTQNIIKGNII